MWHVKSVSMSFSRIVEDLESLFASSRFWKQCCEVHGQWLCAGARGKVEGFVYGWSLLIVLRWGGMDVGFCCRVA